MPLYRTVLLALLLSACGSAESDEKKSYGCDASTSESGYVNLVDIVIDDQGADPADKARYLGELDNTRTEFTDVLRARGVIIKINNGSVTDFEEFADLKGQTPKGYEGTGKTWDDVGGAADSKAVYLGSSKLASGTLSRVIHESTHSVDGQLSLAQSTAVQDLYNADVATRGASEYRMSNASEYLAVAVDEYFCKASSRASLQSDFPGLFEYLDVTFFPLLTELLAQ